MQKDLIAKQSSQLEQDRGKEEEMCTTSTKTFSRDKFRTTKEWIYFCLEFGLDLCDGCFCHARKQTSGEVSSGPWHCNDCQPPLHQDLMKAIRTKSNIKTECNLCGEETSISNCWISDDCQRVYCAKHLSQIPTKEGVKLAPSAPSKPKESWTRREASEKIERLTKRAIQSGRSVKQSTRETNRFEADGLRKQASSSARRAQTSIPTSKGEAC